MKDENRVLIAGGGIGGLALGLTLHQIGVPFTIFEAASEVRPLGVGINLQPNAVRELFDLGIGEDHLDAIGVPAREWALVGLNGNDIYAEPRGRLAGYNWPQYACHRGKLQVLLHDILIERAGADVIQTGHRATAYRQSPDGVQLRLEATDGAEHQVDGALLVGADGIHSTTRAQMHPDQPPIHWGGALMWRGTTQAKPIRTGSSFIGLGTHQHRMVIYPISHADAETGLAQINWIAELAVDARDGWQKHGWFTPVSIDSFAHHFDAFRYDWLDVPALLQASEIAYENPMIDRDPVDTWVSGRVALLGDAAHAMYPTGSNGASQAIVDARVLGACVLATGIGPQALADYDAKLCGPVSELVLRNRGAGPFGLLNIVDERCGGQFNDIDAVIPPDERADFMAGYKAAAGFAIDALNAAEPTIPEGSKVRN